MTIEELPGGIDPKNPAPIRGPTQRGEGATRVPGQDEQSEAFAALLEKLQRLRLEGKEPGAMRGGVGSEGAGNQGAGPGAGAPNDPVRELGEALRRAGDAHEAAMDIKRRLEAAFRRATGG